MISSKRIVISLGGNALGYEPEKQLEKVKEAVKLIADLSIEGYEIIIAHGNGPQVGLVNLAFESAHKNNALPSMPFPECGAMTQGYIGYHLQQSLQNELINKASNKSCVTLITQVEVDPKDPAFSDPSKPIGDFYDKEEAKQLSKENGYIYKEDAGRGYRRVVASPEPIDILEKDMIRQLMHDHIVICCGGGGVPVIKGEKGYQGIAAVIDKDRTSALLADILDADILMILTAVDQVCLNFKKENEIRLNTVHVDEMNEYLKQGHFAKGSMLPKVEACLSFVKEDREAIITSLDNAKKALSENQGTHIIK